MDLSRDELLLALEWQLELGADEAICETPVDRTALDPIPAKPAAATDAAETEAPPDYDPVAEAKQAAEGAQTLEDLRGALEAFEGCELKLGAQSLVFSDGLPRARVMILGEAPGRDEDRLGKPFVGRAGQLLDQMLGAIGLGRDQPDPASAVYITNVLPWRPPQNRDPSPEEIAMLMPFVARHIELAAPDLLVVMGNTACQALLGRRGITKLRGRWSQVGPRPCLPMFHPAYLLRTPQAKREAWADLLELRAQLDQA